MFSCPDSGLDTFGKIEDIEVMPVEVASNASPILPKVFSCMYRK